MVIIVVFSAAIRGEKCFQRKWEFVARMDVNCFKIAECLPNDKSEHVGADHQGSHESRNAKRHDFDRVRKGGRYRKGCVVDVVH